MVSKLGDNFSTMFDRLAAMNPTLAAETIVRLPEWREYQDRNWLPEHGMYRGEKEARDEADRLRGQLIEERAKGGAGDMTEEQITDLINKRITEGNYIKKDELTAVNGPLANSVNGLAKRFEDVYTDLEEQRFDYENTFKEALPYRQIMKYMAEKGERDTVSAYKAVTSEKWTDHRKKQYEAEIAAAEKRGEERARQNFVQREGGQGIPVNSGSTGRGMPHFMAKIFRQREERAKGSVTPGRLGDGTATKEGFADYNKKQMASSGSI